jgi:predicted phosphodiesterase
VQKPTKLNRRELLQLGAGSLLALGLWPGALEAEGKGGPGDFHFLVVNDIHYQDKDCGQWLQGVVKQMKGLREKPAFCLVAGDLAEHGKSAELAGVRDAFKGLGTPAYVVIGNHDYLTQDDRKAYEDIFPRRINYHFAHRSWQFVGLDTSEGRHYENTKVAKATLTWLDRTLPKLNRKRPTVVFTHFPLGTKVPMRPLNADDVLNRFKKYNLQAVFCGHFHGFTERRVGGVSCTTNCCCSFRSGNHDSTKDKGFFLCHAKDGKLKRTFVKVKTP